MEEDDLTGGLSLIEMSGSKSKGKKDKASSGLRRPATSTSDDTTSSRLTSRPESPKRPSPVKRLGTAAQPSTKKQPRVKKSTTPATTTTTTTTANVVKKGSAAPAPALSKEDEEELSQAMSGAPRRGSPGATKKPAPSSKAQTVYDLLRFKPGEVPHVVSRRVVGTAKVEASSPTSPTPNAKSGVASPVPSPSKCTETAALTPPPMKKEPSLSDWTGIQLVTKPPRGSVFLQGLGGLAKPVPRSTRPQSPLLEGSEVLAALKQPRMLSPIRAQTSGGVSISAASPNRLGTRPQAKAGDHQQSRMSVSQNHHSIISGGGDEGAIGSPLFPNRRLGRGKEKLTAAEIPLKDVTSDHVAVVNSSECRTHLQVMVEMRDSMYRVDRILGHLGRDQPIPTDYDGSNFSDAKVVDPGLVDELKDVITVLLRDIGKQTQTVKEMDIADQRRELQLREAKEEIRAATRAKDRAVEEAQEMAEQMVAMQETIQDLETELERLHLQANSALAMSGGGVGLQGSSFAFGAGQNEPRMSMADGSPIPSAALGSTYFDADAMASSGGGPVSLMPSTFLSAPTGRVFIVSTAIQANKQLWERFPKDMPVAVQTHNQVIRAAIQATGGYQVKTVAEEFMVVYKKLEGLTEFVAKVNQDLVDQCWPEPMANHPDCRSQEVQKEIVDDVGSDDEIGGIGSKMESLQLWAGLRVRMGLHVGEAILDADPLTGGADYMGPVVNKCLTLRRISLGGMVAVSQDFYKELNDDQELAAQFTVTFHCMLPSSMASQGPVSAPPSPSYDDHSRAPDEPKVTGGDEPVYCLLPRLLEDRLLNIQSTIKNAAKAAGIEQPTAPTQDEEDNQPSELEAILGTFKKKSAVTAIVTGDGIFSAEDGGLVSDGAREIEESGLPGGSVAFCFVQIEKFSAYRLTMTEKALASVVDVFADVVDMSIASFGGKVVPQDKRECFFLVFTSLEAAVKCCLNIDAELMHAQWPPEVVSHYAELLNPVLWRDVPIFNGLKVSYGVHPCTAQPHYDPMTQRVGYVGEDAMLASRLAGFAKAGQVLVSERHCHELLIKLDPFPIFFQVTMQSTEDFQVNLCIIQNRCYVGRFFYHRKIPTWDRETRQLVEYKQMRDELLKEDMRWHKKATLVVAAPRQGSSTEGDGTSFKADYRRRDMGLVGEMTVQFCRRVGSHGTNDPIINQLELLEHNAMALHDHYYDGRAVELAPFLLEVADLRGLIADPEGNWSGDALGEDLDIALERDMDVAEEAEALLAKETEAEMNKAGRGARTGRAKDIEAQNQRKAFESLEEEVKELREQQTEAHLDVLGLHRDLRFVLSLLRNWMDPLLDPNKLALTEEEFVVRLLHHHRGNVDELRGRGSGNHKPQTEWRALLSVALEKEGEEAFANQPFKLCRSMLAHIGKHFVYLRAFTRRLKVKEGRK